MEVPSLVRSHSVREPAKAVPSSMSPGGLSHQGRLDPEQPAEKSKAPRDPKRRTVQVEYVAPQSQTTRGEALPPINSPGTDGFTPTSAGPSKSRARAGTDRPEAAPRAYNATTKPLPKDPRSTRPTQAYHGQPSTGRTSQRPDSSQMAPPARPPKDLPRSVSDSTSAFGQMPPSSTTRPATGGSMASAGHGRLPSRGNSYSQPLAPTVAPTNAQGRVTQPKNDNKYNISAPIPQPEPYLQDESIGRPSTQNYGPPPTLAAHKDQSRGHKRSNTLGNFFRTGSISGPRSQPGSPGDLHREKRYPPTSMKNPIVPDSPRQSTDSRRPSFGFGRKSSDLRKNSELSKEEKPRRFSLLPASFSFKSFGSTGAGKDALSDIRPTSERRQSSKAVTAPPSRGQSRPQTMNYSRGPRQRQDEGAVGSLDGGGSETMREMSTQQQAPRSNLPSRGTSQTQQNQYISPRNQDRQDRTTSLRTQQPVPTYADPRYESDLSDQPHQHRPVYPPGFGNDSYDDEPRPSMQQARPSRGPAVLQKNNRRFADAYEQDQEPGAAGGGHHAGSSGAAKRVMDFFRRRGRARTGDDRV